MAMTICHPDCPRAVEKVARLVHHQINSAGNATRLLKLTCHLGKVHVRSTAA